MGFLYKRLNIYTLEIIGYYYIESKARGYRVVFIIVKLKIKGGKLWIRRLNYLILNVEM